MAMQDLSQELAERVRDAVARREAVRPFGGDTKRFYGRRVDATPLALAGHRGIVNHDPAELLLTVRCGTRLADIEQHLAGYRQRLPFEPPHFGAAATIGGAVAAGLAGPARARCGPVRDALLGVRLLTGDGRLLRFGGEVMKNVAGYDVARLMAGSLGILGLVLEVSVKLLPRAPDELTLAFDVDQATALAQFDHWAVSAMPLSAAAWVAGRMHVRFEGAVETMSLLARRLGGERVAEADDYWASLREQTHPCFAATRRVWRLQLPAGTAPLPLPGLLLVEWGGMQRWYADEGHDPRPLAAELGGTATLFRGAVPGEEPFAPLAEPVLRLHRSLKRVFDPAGILNPGRMYAVL